MSSMREKHKHFIDRYLVHGNGKLAAIEAGYAESRAKITASELLARPDIAAAIRKAQDDRSERLGIDADYVVQEALEVYEQARRGEPRTNRGDVVMHEGEVVYDWHPAGAIGALKLVKDVLGLGAAERRVVAHEGEVVYTLRIEDQGPAGLEGDVFDIEALEEGD